MLVRLLTVVALHTPLPTAWAQSPCAPLGMQDAELRAAYASGFSTVNAQQLPAFLSGAIPCLSSLDPFLRDRIAYEGSATLLRREAQRTEEIVAALRSTRSRLISALDPTLSDPDGVRRPFAILLLAEIVRTDRVAAWMTPAERRELLTLAGRYLTKLEDYRAFADGVGFRHGVAHGADLILQLALNTQIPADELPPLVDAIASKISPEDGIAYVTGEPGRLARALFYLMQRSDESPALSAASQNLLVALASPLPYADWGSVFTSEQALRFRHNRRAFAEALYVQLAPHADHDLLAPFLPSLEATLEAIP